MPPTPIPPRCRHLHTDGRQCGSPALRAQPLCFHHTTLRQPIPVKTVDGRTLPQLPAPDDFLAIQRSIAEVLRLLAHEELTDRHAAILLSGLAKASQNLARHRRDARQERAEARAEACAEARAEARTEAGSEAPAPSPNQPVTDCVNHPTLGTLALEDTHVPVGQLPPTLSSFDTAAGPASPAAEAQPAPNTPPDPQIPTQQNQDLSPHNDNFAPPATEDDQPATVPQPRFTPNPGTTIADDERLGEFYLKLEETFRDKRRAFEAQKTAELEAHFQTRLDDALAAAREAQTQSRLEADIAHYFTQSPELQPTQ